MKKLFVIASLMMLTVSAFAQHAPGTLSIQPKVGLNIANITDIDDADPRLGLVAGAELEMNVDLDKYLDTDTNINNNSTFFNEICSNSLRLTDSCNYNISSSYNISKILCS